MLAPDGAPGLGRRPVLGGWAFPSGQPIASPSVKRLLSGTVAAVAILAAASLVSACDVTPPAAIANGATITVASLNDQLRTLQTTTAGSCLLQLEDPSFSSTAGQGAGGPGTYSMEYANAILDTQVGDLLADQYVASKGLTITSADLTKAKSDFESTLDGEIQSAVQQSQEEGIFSYCEGATGTAITGQVLLGALPASIRDAQIRNQAVDDTLLAHGADITAADVATYYLANKSLFTQACVGRIVVATQAEANQAVTQITGGASFASVAEASSIDTQTATDGGSLGCNYTLSGVEQALGTTDVTVGAPVAPVQDSSSGDWIVYEVTSATVEPLSAAAPVALQELLQSAANVNRVSKEIVAFAHGSDVSVNPQYGSWSHLTIVAPVGPPPQYLLAGSYSGSTPTLKGGKPSTARTAIGS